MDTVYGVGESEYTFLRNEEAKVLGLPRLPWVGRLEVSGGGGVVHGDDDGAAPSTRCNVAWRSPGPSLRRLAVLPVWSKREYISPPIIIPILYTYTYIFGVSYSGNEPAAAAAAAAIFTKCCSSTKREIAAAPS